mgnify:CR=1 FL=1
MTSKISIHTTLAGGDFPSPNVNSSDFFISIHTTLAGGDATVLNAPV